MRLMRDALLDLRAHRIRSALAGLALLMAVLSVVAVTTVGTVVRDTFVASDEQLNGRLWTMAGHLDSPPLALSRIAEFTAHLDQQVNATGGSYALTTELAGTVSTSSSDESPGPAYRVPSGGNVTLILTHGNLDEVRRLPMVPGKCPSARTTG